MFYNTTHLTGEELKRERKNAETQEQKIFKFFEEFDYPYTACQVWDLCMKKQVPLTSVRRAITNLNMQGLLRKSPTKAIGIYGKKAYLWRLDKKYESKI